MTPRSFEPKGNGWQDLCRRPLKNCFIRNMLALGLMASEKKIFEGSLATQFYINKWPHWGMASLGPRGLIGRIYVGDHLTLLHTKYITQNI